MSYGQIARLLRRSVSPRAVGWALHQCPESLPWQRVVNARGACSTDRLADHPVGLQRGLLEAEGIRFRSDGTLDMERYRWAPAKEQRRGRNPRPNATARGGRTAVPPGSRRRRQAKEKEHEG